jgi:hypothetical protein
MSLNFNKVPAAGERSARIKHLYRRSTVFPTECEYVPCFYIEARIDYSDVRSGYHETRGMHHVMEIMPLEEDVAWTPDMVQTIDPLMLENRRPERARLRNLPAFVTDPLISRIEIQYLSFLLRHAQVRVLRNFSLNLYSHPGESRDDFMARCLEVFKESFRSDLDALREVMNRRLERIEEKFLRPERAAGFDSDRRASQVRNRFHTVSERIAELFLNTGLTWVDPVLALPYPEMSLPELEHHLDALEMSVHQEILRLLASYREKVRNIDEYIIHPGLKDLHLVRTCILWVPVEVPEP